MKRVSGGDDFESPFVVAESSRQLDQTLVRFRAAIGKEDSSVANVLDEPLRKFSLKFLIVKV